MTKKDIVEAICNCYSDLPEECKIELAELASLTSYTENKILIKEGQYSDDLFFIAKGSARAYYLKNGKDITDWFAFKNDFISSIRSYFLDVKSEHYIEVSKNSTLFKLSRKDVLYLSDKYRDFERLGTSVITQVMLKLQKRIVSLQFETASQKYKSLIQLHPNIEQEMPLTHIASHLGITLETLSRIRNPKKRI